jgi:diguanylate cyclase (GGDEF)-like protein
MTGPFPSAPEIALVCGSVACATACILVALRQTARARSDRLALRLVYARERSLADSARRLSSAARESAHAVREELAAAASATEPAIDGVLFYDEVDAELHCTAAFGARFEYFTGARVVLEDRTSLPARAIALGHRVTLDDHDVEPLHPSDRAALAVPLGGDAGGRCAVAFSAQTQLGAETIERLVALADQAAPAYAIALDRERDRRRAEYDGLTGLLTPRAFRQRLTALVERSRYAPATSLALIFADTDHFKRWNDTYGHPSGDLLLRELAQTLRSCAAPRDLIARNGGDEFCLVFVDTEKAAAIERAEALRRRIAQIDVEPLRPPRVTCDVSITASIGVAAFPADAASASELLERADAAMYHAKHNGRDGVSYARPDRLFARLDGGAPSLEYSTN